MIQKPNSSFLLLSAHIYQYQEHTQTQTLHKHKTQHKCAAPCVAATAAWYVLFWEEQREAVQREAVQFFNNKTKENKG